MRASRPTILVDTREQDPWLFSPYRVGIRRASLPSGDYSVEGHESGGIIVERKSMTDLFGSMTSGRVRFFNELRRLSEFEQAFLVVEASGQEILRGSRRTSVSPGRMLESLFGYCAANGVATYLCAGRADAEETAFRLLNGFWTFKGGRYG